MKKKIVNVFLMALLATATVGTVVSCKDYEEDNYSDLKGQITNVEGLNNALEERVKALETAKDQMNQEIQSLKDQLGTADDDATKNTIYGRIASLEALVATINGQITDINNTLTTHGDQLAELYRILDITDGVSGTIKDIYEQIGSNKDAIDALLKITPEDTTAWHGAVQDASAALSLAKMDSARIDALEDILGDDFADFKQNVIDALTDAEGNWINVTDFVEEKLKNYLTNEDLDGYATDQDLQDVKDAYDKMDVEFKDSLELFQSRIDAVAADLEAKTNELNNKLGILQSILNQYVSGVIIQGTNNPVYGTFSIPVGVSSNILAAYYGNLKNGDVGFPVTTNDSQFAGKYVFSKDGTGTTLTEEDLEMLRKKGSIEKEVYAAADHKYLVSDEVGNAGTLYLTINPVGQDHTNATPTLENSAGVQSMVALSPLKPSDKVLSFGYTRNVANGFYETKATVYEESIDEVKPRVSYEDMKEIYNEAKNIVKKLIDNKSTAGIDVKPLVTSLYSAVSNVLDANAVKFSWTAKDEEGNGIDTERSVVSKYELAATAIRPLSYNTWINANYDRLPGIGHVEDIIGKVFDKIQNAIPEFDIDDVNIEISPIVITPGTIDKVETTVNVYEKGWNADMPGSEEHIIGTATVDITDKVQNAINDAMDGVQGDLNAFVDDLNEQIDQINDLIAQLKQVNDIGQSIEDIEDQIYDYLYKGEDIALKFINNANKLLQPVMLVKTADSFIIPSSSASAPTRVKASSIPADGISIYPTSYTAEIVAPAYKKLVGVTNVFDKNGNSAQGGNAACLKALENANNKSNGLAEVQYGTWNRAKLALDATPGYVYEVVYTAVDYSGRVVAKKYYIELN